MPATAQLQPTSDIDELEQIASQNDIHVNIRRKQGSRGWGGGLFGWSAAPNIERASPAREPNVVAIESPKLEASPPVTHLFFGCEVTSYSELINGLRQKLAVFGIRYEDFDDLAGFADGMTGKALGPSQVKRLGIEKLFDGLRAAGLRLRLEDDPEQHAKMVERISENYIPREASQARTNNRNHARPSEVLIQRVLNYLCNTRGGLARLNNAVNKARANGIFHASNVRWGKTEHVRYR
jgi:hypothetical protein